MDSYIKKLIIEEYKIAFENINEIVSGKRPNWWVKSPNQYLAPSVVCKETSFEDERGEFNYYNKICETLEKLLAGQKAKYTCHFNEAPEEIKQMLEEAV